ncbi:MAG: SOS response-associated peptidase, partial [Pseudomonadota bacterium]
MCGRYGLDIAWEELFAYFNLLRPTEDDRGPDLTPRRNIAPTQPIMVVRNGYDAAREALLARWGLLPSWVKDPKAFTLLLNARSETAAEKPSFRAAMRHRRVLIPASGFYEWRRFGKGQKSQPYWVVPSNDNRNDASSPDKSGQSVDATRSNTPPIVAFGGLMETWTGPDGSELDTACILTTAANESFSEIHDRLPLVIDPKDFERWLNCRDNGPSDVADLMAPADDLFFRVIPVSDAVNKVANGGPEVQERVEPARRHASPKAKPNDEPD